MTRTMKAAVVRAFKEPLVIQEVPVPAPGAGQIRFVVLESPGHAAVASAPDDMVRDAVSAHIS